MEDGLAAFLTPSSSFPEEGIAHPRRFLNLDMLLQRGPIDIGVPSGQQKNMVTMVYIISDISMLIY